MTGDIRLAVAGMGNCAAALLQGIEYYRHHDDTGLAYPDFGGYRVEDVSLVCAFDVDERKIDRPASEAMTAGSNTCHRFVDDLSAFDAPVYLGPLKDGVAEHMETEDAGFSPSSGKPVDVAAKLEEHDVDVLVVYLPVGSTAAVERYAKACLVSDTALVNAIPVFIASDDTWAHRFSDAGVPVVGDDIKSQIGATITHRTLVEMLMDRGATLTNTYQLNYGGNTDFRNMLARDRLTDKKTSKTEAVESLLDEPLGEDHIHIGPSDYVSWMDDTKRADIRIEGELFGGVSFELEAELTVEDSPNSAGSAVNAIRGAKLGLDRDLAGPVNHLSALTMKRPPKQLTDEEARRQIADFL